MLTIESLLLQHTKVGQGLLIWGQSWGDTHWPPVCSHSDFAFCRMKHYENDGCGGRKWCEAVVGVWGKFWMTFLHFEITGQSEPEDGTGSRSLFLLKERVLLLESWWGSREGFFGDEMATGGISMELSCGGGCCHCGSGPARRRVCSSGPASTTAFKSLPFSGNGFFCANSSTACSGVVGCGVELPSGEGMLFSSPQQSEEAVGEECFSEMPPCCGSFSVLCDLVSLCCCWWVWTSCCCCCCWSSCWSSSFSSISFWNCAWASSLSLMTLLKRSLAWINSHSFLVISSLADTIVASSSKVVYRRECFKSSNPCNSSRMKQQY